MPQRFALPAPRLHRMPRVVALVLALGTAAATQATEVRVYTDRQHPVTAMGGAQVIELDRAARVQSELAARLPTSPRQAAATVQQRLREGGPALQRRLAEAYQGVTDAWSLGVTQVPAVVVDRRYVVYGEPDVARAVARIAQYRRTAR